MASVNYAFPITRGGLPQLGQSPTFSTFIAFTTDVPGADHLSDWAPAIIEIGGGWYGFAYDCEAHGEALAVIDSGNSFSGGERYTFASMTKNAGRVLAALDGQGRLNSNALDQVPHLGAW